MGNTERRELPTGTDVAITNPGCCYSSYKEMAVKMKATNWKPGSMMGRTAVLGRITASATHPNNSGLRLYLVQVENDHEYIIGEDGVEELTDRHLTMDMIIDTVIKKLKETQNETV